jgi:hypothetical protein
MEDPNNYGSNVAIWKKKKKKQEMRKEDRLQQNDFLKYF